MDIFCSSWFHPLPHEPNLVLPPSVSQVESQWHEVHIWPRHLFLCGLCIKLRQKLKVPTLDIMAATWPASYLTHHYTCLRLLSWPSLPSTFRLFHSLGLLFTLICKVSFKILLCSLLSLASPLCLRCHSSSSWVGTTSTAWS